MNQLWLIFLAAGGATGMVLIIAGLRRWPVLGLLFASASILTTWEIPSEFALANVNGLSIYPSDIVATVFLGAALLSSRQFAANMKSIAVPWMFLNALLGAALVRGLLQLSTGTVVTEFRSFLYPMAALAWGLSIDWTVARARSLETWSKWLGWLLVVVTVYHVARYGLGSANQFVTTDSGIDQTGRPLVSGQALALFLAAVICLRTWRSRRNKWDLWSAIAFLAAVAISQQRTVWAVAAALGALAFVRSGAATRIRVLAFAVVAFVLVVLGLANGGASTLISDLGTSDSSSGTYDGRVNSWSALLTQSFTRGAGDVLFGAPFGTGFGRYEGVGRWVEFAPHNWYLTVYLRAGAVGLGLLLAVILMVAIRAFRNRTDPFPIVIILASAIYGWSYSWVWYVGPFLAWAIVAAREDRLHLKEVSQFDAIEEGNALLHSRLVNSRSRLAKSDGEE